MTKNELAKITGSEIAKTVQEFGITDIIKPLVKEIDLFETYLSGVLETDLKLLKALKKGDKLILRKSTDEYFGGDEITVFTEKQKKVGYIPEMDCAVFLRLMDAGKLLTAKVVSLDFESKEIPIIKIKIYLVDY